MPMLLIFSLNIVYVLSVVPEVSIRAVSVLNTSNNDRFFSHSIEISNVCLVFAIFFLQQKA